MPPGAPGIPKLLVTSAGAPVSDRLYASLRFAMVGFVTDVLVAGVSKADWKSALPNGLRPENRQQHRDAPGVTGETIVLPRR